MNSRKSHCCRCWRSRKTLVCTINYQQTTSTMSPEERSFAMSATWHHPRPPCLPLPCPSLSSPSLWLLPAQQDPLLCQCLHSRLQQPRRRPLRCRAPRNLVLTMQTPLWPPTTRCWSQTQPNLHARSQSPKLTAANCRSSPNSHWFSATQVLSSHPPISRHCFPRQAQCSSRLLCLMVPSAGGVLLMIAAT